MKSVVVYVIHVNNTSFSIFYISYDLQNPACFFFYQDPPIIINSHSNGKDTMWEYLNIYIYITCILYIYIICIYFPFEHVVAFTLLCFRLPECFILHESKLSIEWEANASLTAELKREAASSWLLMAVVGMLIASSKFGHDHIHSFKSVCHTCTMLSCPNKNALFSHKIWDFPVPLVALSNAAEVLVALRNATEVCTQKPIYSSSTIEYWWRKLRCFEFEQFFQCWILIYNIWQIKQCHLVHLFGKCPKLCVTGFKYFSCLPRTFRGHDPSLIYSYLFKWAGITQQLPVVVCICILICGIS